MHSRPALFVHPLIKMAAASSAPSSSAPKTFRKSRVSAEEVIEAVMTAGSDVEEEGEEALDSDGWSPGSELSDESDGSVFGLEEDENFSSDLDLPAANDTRVGDMSTEDFLNFLMIDWHTDFSFFPALPPYSLDAEVESGLHVEHMQSHTPFLFFSEIFDDELLDLIVEQTNKYAQENIAVRGELKENSSFKRWPAGGMTRNDLLGFLTICVHMALVHKPHLNDYWSTSPMLDSHFPRNIMPRDKFLLLLAMLHVSDNDTFIPRDRPGHDPLHKLRPVYEHLRLKYKSLYTPKENICVDEAMCPWRGNLRFRVYMRDKPIKWGVKLYELCESDTAYVYDFEIYAGVPGLSNRAVDVVMRLVEPLLDKGRTVYVDNYYCCPELAEALAKRDTHTVGTVRANRVGMPPQLKTTPLPPRGQVHAYRQGATAVLRWMDKKPVHVITTKMDPRLMKNVISRNNPNNQKMKPEAVQDYICNMSGVDKSDQLMSYSPFHRKTMKWWKKVFFHLFTLSIIQASILHDIFHTARGKRKLPLKSFVVELGLAMNDRYQEGVAAIVAEAAAAAANPQAPAVAPPAAVPQPTPTTAQTRLSGTGHYCVRIGQVASGTGRSKFRWCRVCRKREKRHADHRSRKTAFQCSKCRVPLCNSAIVYPGDNAQMTCFMLYHTVKNFKQY